MKINFLVLALLACSFSRAQTISGTTPATPVRSGRIVLQGSSFGSNEGQVTVNGTVAPVAHWSETAIVAYIPETSSLGSGSVRVTTSGGASSNAFSVSIANRGAATGPIKWTFEPSGMRIVAQPVAGPDGTIYVSDINTNLYVLTPSGGLKGLRRGATSGEAAISTDGAGNIYVGGEGFIKSFTSQGTLRWTYTFAGQLEAGPSLGPDGKVYLASRDGFGAMILDATSGQLLWSDARVINPGVAAVHAKQIAFGGGKWSFVVNPANFSTTSTTWVFNLGGGFAWSKEQGLNGTASDSLGRHLVTASVDRNSLRCYNADSSQQWSLPFSIIGKAIATPRTSSDGRIYAINALSEVKAISSGGSVVWSRKVFNINFETSVEMGVRPDGQRIIGTCSPALMQPTTISNYDPTGALIWTTALPTVDGFTPLVTSRIGFSRDQSLGLIGTSVNEYSPLPKTVLYAVDASVGRIVRKSGFGR